MDDTEGKNPNIIVTVRVRPETQEESNSQSFKTIVRCLDEKLIIFDPADPNKAAGRGAPNNHGRSKDLKFGFDRVFDPYAAQFEVFQHTTRTLINEVLSGFNCTCFAYGATGAGKTFTMIGNKENPGVMVLTMKELFQTMDEREDKTYDVSISYLEIYNETIRDLLVKNSKPLDLRESADAGVQVAGLSAHKPSSADEVLQLLEVGNSRRCQSATGANAQSSRSHAVLQISVEQRDRTANVSTEVKVGKLSLIDLAGSERASRTKTRGQQLVEGANINKSLLALGNCINALGQDYKEGKYVPYRNSKLTRLLKDSLGGNCKTVMIANVSPSSLSYEDTYNTLNYANRAKNIKTKVHTNQINVKVHVSQYKNLIDQLRVEIEELKGKLRDYERNGRSAGQDSRERAQIEEIRSEISRAVQDRQTVEANLRQLQQREKEIQDQRESAVQRIEQWQIDKWNRTQATRISGALGAAAENKPPSSPIDIHQARRKVQELESEELEIQSTKETLLRRLERNAEETKQLHGHVPSRVQSDVGRRQLERDLSIHWLELEKVNRDIEIRRQQHTIRAMQEQLSQAFRLLEIQHEKLEQNELLTPGVQERFDCLMWTPNRTHKRSQQTRNWQAPTSPFLKIRSPLAPTLATSDQDLPGLVQIPTTEEDEDDGEPVVTRAVDLSSQFNSTSYSMAQKENHQQSSNQRAHPVFTSSAAKTVVPKVSSVPAVARNAARFGFAGSNGRPNMAPGMSTPGIRKTPSKPMNPSILHMRRRPEDKYPSAFTRLQSGGQPVLSAANNGALKTPSRASAKGGRWTPVSSKKAPTKSVRFADEAGNEATPTKTPNRSQHSGFPAIPTPTSIGGLGRQEPSTPSRPEPSEQVTHDEQPVVVKQPVPVAVSFVAAPEPVAVEPVAVVETPSASAAPAPAIDDFDLNHDLPEPPTLSSRFVQLLGAVSH